MEPEHVEAGIVLMAPGAPSLNHQAPPKEQEDPSSNGTLMVMMSVIKREVVAGEQAVELTSPGYVLQHKSSFKEVVQSGCEVLGTWQELRPL